MERKEFQAHIDKLTGVIDNATLFRDELIVVEKEASSPTDLVLGLGEAGVKYGMIDPKSAHTSKLLPELKGCQMIA